jgi:chromosome segregation ATPase
VQALPARPHSVGGGQVFKKIGGHFISFPQLDRGHLVLVGALTMAAIISALGRTVFVAYASTQASGRMHQRLMHVSGAEISLGDAKSSRGDAKSSLGDAKSSLGGAESSLGGAESSLGDAKSSLGDAESSLGDAESSLGDAKSSLDGAKSSLGDAKSSLGDAKRLAR